jgi:serine/threonine protein kinase/tetratricopeptide (TPR) repeat protein
MTEGVSASQGRAISSRYTLLEKLGAGGQAEVWRARDEKTGNEVALKILNPSVAHDEAAWAALVREHAIASRLDHPAILKVYPPFREGDFVGLPMELASGGDLRRLRGKSYLDILPVLIDIAQGLEYAHEHGVIHRDLKPGNVLFDSRGRVRVADFGIAGTPGEVQPAVVRPGLSPFTASPEHLRGDPPAISDDIYGLGALAYELLSGYPPYYPRFDVKRALDEPVPELKPAQLMPHQLSSTIMRMLSKRASLRPRSMRDVIDDFDAALNDTLAFEFDGVEEPVAGATASMRRDAAVLAAAHPSYLHDIDEELRTGAAPKPAAKPEISPIAERAGAVPSSRANRTDPPRTNRTDPPRTNRAEPARPQPEPIAPSVEAAKPAPKPEFIRHVVLDEEPPEPLPSPADVAEVEGQRIAAAAAAVRDAAPHLVTASTPPTYWDDVRLRVDPSPQYQKKKRPPRRSWPWVLLTALVAAAVLVFVVLPKYGSLDELLPSSMPQNTASSVTASTPPASAPKGEVESPLQPASKPSAEPASASPSTAVLSAPPAEKPAAVSAEAIEKARTTFDQRLASLESRGAGFWGGPDFAAAKTRAAEAVGANDAGSPELAKKRLDEALNLLSVVESRANQSLTAQLTAGDEALAAGQAEVAKQAYESAKRIDPNNKRAQDGLQRVRNLGGLLPLLADGENAEAAKDYARAVQDYSQALSLDPNNAKAKAGLDRAHAAFGDDTYAKSVGTGFAALGAGRLEDARVAFEKARSMRPNGPEAATGLARVGAALRARGFASTRQQGAGLEAEERWSEAVDVYDAALKVDPSLVFAQQGKARAQARAELNDSLQALIDRPERLASPAVRAEADTLIKRAAVQDPSGPVLRSQIARLQILLPGFDTPVRLEMVSDNATQVQIQRVGTFGTFSKREIELKPGKYTVVGTRPGFRDVRRDVTIAPGGDVQTISVSCVEPI